MPITYLRLSGVYDYLERPTDMIKAARKFADLEPNLMLSHLNLGLALHSSGFFEEAIVPLNRAVTIDGKKVRRIWRSASAMRFWATRKMRSRIFDSPIRTYRATRI